MHVRSSRERRFKKKEKIALSKSRDHIKKALQRKYIFFPIPECRGLKAAFQASRSKDWNDPLETEALSSNWRCGERLGSKWKAPREQTSWKDFPSVL
jgi:hypothetical protein